MTENKIGDVELKSAQSAFDSFFSKDPNVKDTNTPKQQVDVTTVNTNDKGEAAKKVMSTQDAKDTVEQEKSFKDILKELGIKFSELFPVIDSLLESGAYSKTYKIKGLIFTLSTKKTYAIDWVNDALDGAKFTLPNAVGQMVMEYSLASSLVSIKQGKNTATIFEHNSIEDDEKVLSHIKGKITSPIYSILVGKLKHFELVTGLATREEAIDHFLEQTQD